MTRHCGASPPGGSRRPSRPWPGSSRCHRRRPPGPTGRRVPAAWRLSAAVRPPTPAPPTVANIPPPIRRGGLPPGQRRGRDDDVGEREAGLVAERGELRAGPLAAAVDPQHAHVHEFAEASVIAGGMTASARGRRAPLALARRQPRRMATASASPQSWTTHFRRYRSAPTGAAAKKSPPTHSERPEGPSRPRSARARPTARQVEGDAAQRRVLLQGPRQGPPLSAGAAAGVRPGRAPRR
jgi:hypothetical protein